MSSTDIKAEPGKGGENPDKKKSGFQRKPQTTNNRPTTKFEGRSTELKGFIYDHGEHKNPINSLSPRKKFKISLGEHLRMLVK